MFMVREYNREMITHKHILRQKDGKKINKIMLNIELTIKRKKKKEEEKERKLR